MRFVLYCLIINLLTQLSYAEEFSFLSDQPATHEYHGDGEASSTENAELTVDENSEAELKNITISAWVREHLPQIFSQDFINYGIHDKLINGFFTESGQKGYEVWQKKQVALLVKHQFIVKASLGNDIDWPASDIREITNLKVPLKLLFQGLGKQGEKVVEIVEVTCQITLKPKAKHTWIISEFNVNINDNRKQN